MNTTTYPRHTLPRATANSRRSLHFYINFNTFHLIVIVLFVIVLLRVSLLRMCERVSKVGVSQGTGACCQGQLADWQSVCSVSY